MPQNKRFNKKTNKVKLCSSKSSDSLSVYIADASHPAAEASIASSDSDDGLTVSPRLLNQNRGHKKRNKQKIPTESDCFDAADSASYSDTVQVTEAKRTSDNDEVVRSQNINDKTVNCLEDHDSAYESFSGISTARELVRRQMMPVQKV